MLWCVWWYGVFVCVCVCGGLFVFFAREDDTIHWDSGSLKTNRLCGSSVCRQIEVVSPVGPAETPTLTLKGLAFL